MATSTNIANYGAMEPSLVTGSSSTTTEHQQHQEELTSLFDERQAYYLRSKPRTLGERWKQASRICVPLMIALLFVGGAVWLLSQNFQHLYPGPSGGSSSGDESSRAISPRSNPMTIRSPPPVTAGVVTLPPTPPSNGGSGNRPATVPTNKPLTTGSVSSTACNAHRQCFELGLEGECCPTPEQTFLDCCS